MWARSRTETPYGGDTMSKLEPNFESKQLKSQLVGICVIRYPRFRFLSENKMRQESNMKRELSLSEA
jgi:hypothetical protein